ncbi:hypothetical protein Y032_0874g2808, partial [Ancylostoma ceylanicum]
LILSFPDGPRRPSDLLYSQRVPRRGRHGLQFCCGYALLRNPTAVRPETMIEEIAALRRLVLNDSLQKHLAKATS